MKKIGSLFDGIGGFPLAATLHGITPAWASEIEPFPIEVTKARFPGMKHLGDITQINGAEIEPVDVITFGSPCQDLSIAGKRDGLEGKRSNLFFEAVRIIREMRRATDGRHPRFAVWENVPGAFSSNGGADFQSVLEEITEAEIPMPHTGRWATAGMVRGGKCEVAWRVLDAQYWGVPQRRRRIFLVADFAGQSAGEILFKCESLSGDIAEGGKEGQGIAANAEGSTGTAGKSICLQGSMIGRADKNGPQGDGINEDVSFTLNTTDRHAVAYGVVSKGNGEAWVTPERHMALNTGGGQAGQGYPAVLTQEPKVYGICSDASNSMKSDNPHSGIYEADTTRTLDQNGGNPACNQGGMAIVQSIDCTPNGISGTVSAKWAKGTGGPAGDECQNLVAFQPGNLIRQAGAPPNEKTFPTLGATTLGDQFPHVAQLYENHGQDSRFTGPLDVAQPVTATYGMGGNNQPFVVKPSAYTVRRLTPLECERLQGFPDGWTDIPGASDTGRYKALGNSVAVPCVEWIIGRIIGRGWKSPGMGRG